MKPNHIASLMAVVFFVLTANVSAQVVNPADAAKNKGVDNTNQNIDQTLDKGVNAVQNSLKGTVQKERKNYE